MHILLFITALPSDIVVIGDSQAEGMQASRALPGVEFHAFRGMPAAFFLRWLAQHPETVTGKSVIYFQLGGNDVSLGHAPQSLIEDMNALESLAHSMAPDARVYFGLIPVRGQWFDAQSKRKPLLAERQEQTLDAVNWWLAYGDHPRISTLPVNDVIANGRLQRDEFKRRGAADVHLNKRGYVAMSTALAETLLH